MIAFSNWSLDKLWEKYLSLPGHLTKQQAIQFMTSKGSSLEAHWKHELPAMIQQLQARGAQGLNIPATLFALPQSPQQRKKILSRSAETSRGVMELVDSPRARRIASFTTQPHHPLNRAVRQKFEKDSGIIGGIKFPNTRPVLGGRDHASLQNRHVALYSGGFARKQEEDTRMHKELGRPRADTRTHFSPQAKRTRFTATTSKVGEITQTGEEYTGDVKAIQRAPDPHTIPVRALTIPQTMGAEEHKTTEDVLPEFTQPQRQFIERHERGLLGEANKRLELQTQQHEKIGTQILETKLGEQRADLEQKTGELLTRQKAQLASEAQGMINKMRVQAQDFVQLREAKIRAAEGWKVKGAEQKAGQIRQEAIKVIGQKDAQLQKANQMIKHAETYVQKLQEAKSQEQRDALQKQLQKLTHEHNAIMQRKQEQVNATWQKQELKIKSALEHQAKQHKLELDKRDEGYSRGIRQKEEQARLAIQQREHHANLAIQAKEREKMVALHSEFQTSMQAEREKDELRGQLQTREHDIAEAEARGRDEANIENLTTFMDSSRLFGGEETPQPSPEAMSERSNPIQFEEPTTPILESRPIIQYPQRDLTPEPIQRVSHFQPVQQYQSEPRSPVARMSPSVSPEPVKEKSIPPTQPRPIIREHQPRPVIREPQPRPDNMADIIRAALAVRPHTETKIVPIPVSSAPGVIHTTRQPVAKSDGIKIIQKTVVNEKSRRRKAATKGRKKKQSQYAATKKRVMAKIRKDRASEYKKHGERIKKLPPNQRKSERLKIRKSLMAKQKTVFATMRGKSRITLDALKKLERSSIKWI